MPLQLDLEPHGGKTQNRAPGATDRCTEAMLSPKASLAVRTVQLFHSAK
jgi:hypothetical protein